MSSTYDVHVNHLPAEARTRLAACLAGRGDIRPILESRSRWQPLAVLAALVALAAPIAIAHLWTSHFGEVASNGARLGAAQLAMIGGLVAAPLVALGLLVRRVALIRRLPFAPGFYIIGADLVDARRAVLRITSVANARFQATHHYLNGVYGHTSFTFRTPAGSYTFGVKDRAAADAVLATLRSTLVAFLGAAQRQDLATLRSLDVFFSARISPRWGRLGAQPPPVAPPDGPVAIAVPRVLRLAPVAGLVAAAAIAPCLAWMRDAASDDAMFASADTAAELWQYLARGARHLGEARARLPGVALEEARAARSVAALRRYVEDFPAEPLAGAARVDIHRRFADALASFRAKVGPRDARALAFVERLLAFQESAGSPPVAMYFRPPRVASLAAMDATVDRARRAAKAELDVVPLEPHFRAEAIKGREDAISDGLRRGFADFFAGDMVEIRAGARLEADAAVPDAASATIEVSYEVAPMRDDRGIVTYTEQRPALASADAGATRSTGRIFLGIRVHFDVAMRVPGDAEPYHLAFDVLPPAHFSVPQQRAGAADDADVYRVMTDRAFDRLHGELTAAFFAPERPERGAR